MTNSNKQSMGIETHELGHALHYLGRWPDKVTAVDIIMHDDFTEAVPIFADDSALGLGMLVQYLAGSIGERVAAGERDIITHAFHGQDKNPFDYLCDTPFRSEHDLAVFSLILEGTENVDTKLLADELNLCEQILRELYPRVNVHQVSETLWRLASNQHMGRNRQRNWRERYDGAENMRQGAG